MVRFRVRVKRQLTGLDSYIKLAGYCRLSIISSARFVVLLSALLGVIFACAFATGVGMHLRMCVRAFNVSVPYICSCLVAYRL